MRRKWTFEENNYLRYNYRYEEKNNIIKSIDRTWEAIKIQASKLNLKRDNFIQRNSKMENLLNDSNESYYWMGFLLADGHFDMNNFRIHLTLKESDKHHLKLFSKFLEYENFDSCVLEFKNKDIFKKICDKFKIFNSRKTYNPIDFYEYNFTDNQILSLIIGFIDGDGSINKIHNRNDCSLSLHIHSSWLKNLIFIEEFIYNYFLIEKNKILSKIGNDGYAKLIFSNSIILTNIKKELKFLNIPYMKRKWYIIDENFISRPNQTIINKQKVHDLYHKLFDVKEISNILNLKISLVYSYIRNL